MVSNDRRPRHVCGEALLQLPEKWWDRQHDAAAPPGSVARYGRRNMCDDATCFLKLKPVFRPWQWPMQASRPAMALPQLNVAAWGSMREKRGS